MATTPVEIQLPSGLTGLTLSIYSLTDDSSLSNSDGADTLTEETNAKMFYRASVTEALSGIYRYRIIKDSAEYASGYLYITDTTTVRYGVNTYAEAILHSEWTDGGRLDALLDTAASTGLTTQQIADAVHSLAPTGSPAAGSLGDDTDNLLARITASATTAAAAANGDISTPIIRGDAYNTAAGNAFTVSSAGFPAAVWDAVVTGTLKLLQGTTYSTVGTVAVTHDSSETITATISFTSAETSGLVKDPNTTYELELTVGSDQRTLTGNWAVTGSDE